MARPLHPSGLVSIRPTGSCGGSLGQALVEFTLVLPILLVLLLVVGDFARLFATGIAVESAARDAAEVAAQEYLRNPPAPIGSPIPTPGNLTYYDTIHGYAIETVCKELSGLPNAGYASGKCNGIPTLVCVHDGADPGCTGISPLGATPAPQCASFSSGALPSNAQAGGTETSRYVEVRVCYRFSTILNVSNIAGIPLPFGDFYLDRSRVFTVADY
jgi:TadE-like protein